jgi:hypothetical protein
MHSVRIGGDTLGTPLKVQSTERDGSIVQPGQSIGRLERRI